MPSTEKKKAHDRARMQRKRVETARRIEELEGQCAEFVLFLEGYQPFEGRRPIDIFLTEINFNPSPQPGDD